MNAFASYYNEPEQLDAYGETYLEWPEIMLYHELANGGTEMLDLGIGAGRTSLFFIPVVRRYVGVDIAEGMIERCRQRLNGLGQHGNVDLHVADATDLKGFGDASFDVVLFSYNGLDCIPEQGRDRCFESIRRVLRPGGRLVFSSHNLRFIGDYYRMRRCRGLRSFLMEYRRLGRISRINGPLDHYYGREQVSFWDGVYFDQPDMKHVFVKPEHQIKELERHGFSQVKAISRKNGRELDPAEAAMTREPWVYYSCTRAQ